MRLSVRMYRTDEIIKTLSKYLLISFLIPIILFIILAATAVFYASSSGYFAHLDSIKYDGQYFIYDNDLERFNAIYDDFIMEFNYKKLYNNNKLKRLLFNTVRKTEEKKYGECYELSAALVSRLSFYKIPARVVIGLSNRHTWIEVYFNNEWHTFDPADDIYRYKNGLFWGEIRYYDYKVLIKI